MARVARPKRSRRTLTTLLVLLLLSVTIITLDETGRAKFFTSGMKSLASDIYSPLRHGVDGVLDPVGRFFAGAVDYGSLQRENEKLQDQLRALESRHSTASGSQRQLAELQRLQATDRLPSLSSLPVVVAEVTAQNISNFVATIDIDKGGDQGVRSGDPVVGPGGLVGEVVTVHHTTATVRLLTDGKSEIGVSFEHGQQATLVGTGATRTLQVEYVPATAAVSRGERIVTSGLQGAVFPPGIPVAKVTSVHSFVGAADKQVWAKPLADLGRLSYVEVVQWSGAS
ncbi:MAG: rod shape-determining protein MreC [Acidimicrobiales bacterium]